jgi:hypothetical protein
MAPIRKQIAEKLSAGETISAGSISADEYKGITMSFGWITAGGAIVVYRLTPPYVAGIMLDAPH